jgi:hypothetical protein
MTHSIHPQMLRGNQLPRETKSLAFKMMRTLAGASRQVPKSYLVATFPAFYVEREVIARGGSADIRKGRLNGMDVAVKTIRISAEDDRNIGVIHEVREAVCHLSPLATDQSENQI